MKLFVIISFIALLWGCESSRAYSYVEIRDSSLYSLKRKNVSLRIFVGHSKEARVFEERHTEFDYSTVYQYFCKEKDCVISGFVGPRCEDSCTIEWVVDNVVIRRLTLLEHPDQSSMEFTTYVNGERRSVISESWELDLDSLIRNGI